MALLRVIEPFSVLSDLSGHIFHVGDLVDSTDSAVKGRERFFEPVEAGRKFQSVAVETATAAPGEKRSVSPAAKKAAAKKAAAKKSGDH